MKNYYVTSNPREIVKAKWRCTITKYKSSQEWSEALTVSVGRAAQILGISEYLARQMVKRGELPIIRFGRLVRVPKSRLISMVNGK